MCIRDRDGTARVIAELARANPAVTAVSLMRNFGQHAALLCGIRVARYDVVVTMDDDLQHPPGELPRLLAALTDDVDVVYGSPAAEPHGLLRGLASRVTKWVLQGAMGAATAGHASAWRVFRTRLRDAFAQLASWIGFLLTGFGVAIFGYVLIRSLVEGGSPPGFPFLACLIAVFSGAQLLCLGIIGEYLGRAHFRLLDRPPYQVRSAVGGESGGESGGAPAGASADAKVAAS